MLQTRAALSAIGVRSFADVQDLYTAGDAKMREFVGEGPILTDDRPAIGIFPRRAAERRQPVSLRSDVREIIRE